MQTFLEGKKIALDKTRQGDHVSDSEPLAV
jgi:hypothetical protein